MMDPRINKAKSDVVVGCRVVANTCRAKMILLWLRVVLCGGSVYYVKGKG